MVTQDSGDAGLGEACEAREADVDIRHVGIGSHVGTETQIETIVELLRIPVPSTCPFDITFWLWKTVTSTSHLCHFQLALRTVERSAKATTQLPYRGIVTWLDLSYNDKSHHNTLFLFSGGIIFGEMPTDMQRLTLALYIGPQSGSSLCKTSRGPRGRGTVTRCAIL